MFPLRSVWKRPTQVALICLALVFAPAGSSRAHAQEQSNAPLQDRVPSIQAQPDDQGAQGQSKERSPGTGDGKTSIVEDPPIYYVRDLNGRLVPLLGFSYADLMYFIRQKHQRQTGQASGYSPGEIVLNGKPPRGQGEC